MKNIVISSVRREVHDRRLPRDDLVAVIKADNAVQVSVADLGGFPVNEIQHLIAQRIQLRKIEVEAGHFDLHFRFCEPVPGTPGGQREDISFREIVLGGELVINEMRVDPTGAVRDDLRSSLTVVSRKFNRDSLKRVACRL